MTDDITSKDKAVDQATLAHLTIVTKVLKEENDDLRHHKKDNETLVEELRIMVQEYERTLGRVEKVYEKNPQWQKYSIRKRPTAAQLRQRHAASTKEKNLLVKDLQKELGKQTKKIDVLEKNLEKTKTAHISAKKEVTMLRKELKAYERDYRPVSILQEECGRLLKELKNRDERLAKLKERIEKLVP